MASQEGEAVEVISSLVQHISNQEGLGIVLASVVTACCSSGMLKEHIDEIVDETTKIYYQTDWSE